MAMRSTVSSKKREYEIWCHCDCRAIDTGLYKLTSWQVGGPLQHRNKYLLAHRTRDPLAVGGIMNHCRQAPLRIDVTQHQMHAVILALKYVYIRASCRT